MRDILFRAKNTSNVWQYGDYIYAGDKYGSNKVCCLKDRSLIRQSHCCKIETVGQYTGLDDKNGRGIFEGDIVNVLYNIGYAGVAKERAGLFKVIYDEKGCCFMKEKINGAGLFHFIGSDEIEVVGNVYDNPELLEVK